MTHKQLMVEAARQLGIPDNLIQKRMARADEQAKLYPGVLDTVNAEVPPEQEEAMLALFMADIIAIVLFPEAAAEHAQSLKERISRSK